MLIEIKGEDYNNYIKLVEDVQTFIENQGYKVNISCLSFYGSNNNSVDKIEVKCEIKKDDKAEMSISCNDSLEQFNTSIGHINSDIQISAN